LARIEARRHEAQPSQQCASARGSSAALDERMRTHGTLIKWNDDRGFGFVALPNGHEVFVHVSAFPRDGVRPHIGEVISFEVRTAPDGRTRAEAVERPRGRKASQRHRTPTYAKRHNSIGSLLAGVAVLALGFVGYNSYVSRQHAFASPSASPALETAGRSLRCDGRTHCSQMTSCAEARYFSEHCPGTQMDGDGDGEPCEQQWCN
jgi:cold shock CspA family protein